MKKDKRNKPVDSPPVSRRISDVNTNQTERKPLFNPKHQSQRIMDVSNSFKSQGKLLLSGQEAESSENEIETQAQNATQARNINAIDTEEAEKRKKRKKKIDLAEILNISDCSSCSQDVFENQEKKKDGEKNQANQQNEQEKEEEKQEEEESQNFDENSINSNENSESSEGEGSEQSESENSKSQNSENSANESNSVSSSGDSSQSSRSEQNEESEQEESNERSQSEDSSQEASDESGDQNNSEDDEEKHSEEEKEGKHEEMQEEERDDLSQKKPADSKLVQGKVDEEAKRKEIIKRFIQGKETNFNYDEMIVYCSQSYEIHRCYRDLQTVYSSIVSEGQKNTKNKQHDDPRKDSIFEELHEIGQTADIIKSILYGINEVIILPPKQYSKELRKRERAKANPFIANLVDEIPMIPNYTQKDFQRRYNAFLLFMLNNSQDELLMTYNEFCVRYFPAGLPKGNYSSLPQNYTETDIRDLKNFLQQKENLTNLQYKSVVEKNLMQDKNWKKSTEKDNEGNFVKTIKYTFVLPYIMLGFYLYVTKEAENTLNAIAKSDQAGAGSSLDNCFLKAGLAFEQWNKRMVSYSMAENALLFYKDSNTLNTDQIELVLRMIKEKINVHNLHRQEEKKQYYDHLLPRKSFGRWLISQLALLKKMKEIAQNQQLKKDLTRDQFQRKLIYEEKMAQIAINMEKLDYNIFTKLVTKNLLTLVHARKQFNVYLDLNNYNSISKALEAQIKIESQKAKELIQEEFEKTSQKLVDRLNGKNVEKDEGSRDLTIKNPLASANFRFSTLLSLTPSTFKKQMEQKKQEDEGGNILSEKQFKEESHRIMKQKKELLKKVQQKNIKKLFKATMWQTYSHSSFPKRKPQEKVKAKKKFEGLWEYEKQRNLTHYTVHEFNEALYFAIREFSTYVNFEQVENATYSFFMDNILKEKQLKQDDRESEISKPQGVTYPVMESELPKYSAIFVKTTGNPEVKKKKLKHGFEDNRDPLLKKLTTELLRFRDLKKLEDQSQMKGALQSEVEYFRSMKLCDLEFTRMGYQILIEEAHRQQLQTMCLMYFSTYRCRTYSQPDELIKQMNSKDKQIQEKQTTNLANTYNKLKRKYEMTEKQLKLVRENFMEEQRKRQKNKKTTQNKDGHQDNKENDAEMFLTDVFPPLNYMGYERFKTWKNIIKAQHGETQRSMASSTGVKSKFKNTIAQSLYGQKQEWEGYTNPSKTIGELYEPYKEKYKSAQNFVDTSEKTEPIPEPKGLEDMINIMLSVNYLTGYSEFLHSKKKPEKNDEVKKHSEISESSQSSSNEDNNSLAPKKTKTVQQDLSNSIKDAHSKKAESVVSARTNQSISAQPRQEQNEEAKQKLKESSAQKHSRLSFNFNDQVFKKKPIKPISELLIEEDDDEEDPKPRNKKRNKKDSKAKKEKKQKGKKTGNIRQKANYSDEEESQASGTKSIVFSSKQSIVTKSMKSNQMNLADKIKKSYNQKRGAIDPNDIEMGTM